MTYRVSSIPSQDQLSKAKRALGAHCVMRHARDESDATELLGMLGIIGDDDYQRLKANLPEQPPEDEDGTDIDYSAEPGHCYNDAKPIGNTGG